MTKLFFVLLFLASCSHHRGYHESKKISLKAFKAWETGESGGGYKEFSDLLSSDFDLYSHPLQPSRGVFTGKDALSKMNELIQSREKTPNSLRFKLHHQTCSKSVCSFVFDSEGKVAGGYPYKGWNVIVIGTKNGKVTSFREFLGDIDPSWFQKK